MREILHHYVQKYCAISDVYTNYLKIYKQPREIKLNIY